LRVAANCRGERPCPWSRALGALEHGNSTSEKPQTLRKQGLRYVLGVPSQSPALCRTRSSLAGRVTERNVCSKQSPSEPNAAKILFINEMCGKWAERTQRAYHDYYQSLTAFLGRVLRKNEWTFRPSDQGLGFGGSRFGLANTYTTIGTHHVIEKAKLKNSQAW